MMVTRLSRKKFAELCMAAQCRASRNSQSPCITEIVAGVLSDLGIEVADQVTPYTPEEAITKLAVGTVLFPLTDDGFDLRPDAGWHVTGLAMDSKGFHVELRREKFECHGLQYIAAHFTHEDRTRCGHVL